MSIANELSSEVAAAVFVRNAGELGASAQVLTEIVLQFHTTMRGLTVEARERRRAQPAPAESPLFDNNGNVASNNH